MGKSWGQITCCHGNQSLCSKEEWTLIHGSGSQQRLVSLSLSFLFLDYFVIGLDCEIVNFFFANSRFFVRALNARCGHSSDWLGYLYNLERWYMCWVFKIQEACFFRVRYLPPSLLARTSAFSRPKNFSPFPEIPWDSRAEIQVNWLFLCYPIFKNLKVCLSLFMLYFALYKA